MDGYYYGQKGKMSMQQSPYAAAGMAQQLPPDVAQQAGIYQLGQMNAVFRPTITNPLTIIGLTIVALIADILLTVVIYNIGYIVYVLIVLPIVIIIYCIRGLLACNLRVYLFQNGFIYAKGGRLDVVRWDQVRYVWQRITRNRYGNTSHRYKIERNDGATFTLNSMLKNVGILGQNIQQAVTQVHLPQAIAAYNAGNTIPFGPLSISLQGLSNGKEILPWNQQQNLLLNRGYLLARRQGTNHNWAKVAVSRIPNYLVFIKLANYARTGQI
jgi:hypothetical protein